MRLSLTIVLCFTVFFLPAQEMGWKKHLKTAEEYFEEGAFFEAGTHFHQAWDQKKSQKELLFKAGESFYRARAYREAAEAFRPLKNQNDLFHLIGLKFARCLKQEGLYAQAINEFLHFINIYKGSDYNLLKDIVQHEVYGCELGLQLKEDENTSQTEVVLLPKDINSKTDELAPLPIEGQHLFYTSEKSGDRQFFSTHISDFFSSGFRSNFRFPDLPPEADIESGSFSPDGNRFYFTQCVPAINKYGFPDKQCGIYVTEFINDLWTTPEKLRDYINLAGTSSAQPHVFFQEGKEILLYSSDRDDGQGGKDIWYVLRDQDSKVSDFTYPRNLGAPINTMGDEVTPFYDVDEGVLYFSSNGHINIGGFDIFIAIGQIGNWARPENMGPPFNSPSHDIYYTKMGTEGNGFLVSNRLYNLDRTDTRNFDLFAFRSTENQLSIDGNVFDFREDTPLEGIWVGLYEINPDDDVLELIQDRVFEETYSFTIQHDKLYRLTVRKNGYRTVYHDFHTIDIGPTVEGLRHPFYLEKTLSDDSHQFSDSPDPSSISGYDIGENGPEDKIGKNAESDKIPFTVREEGSYYKVQVTALKKFISRDEKFEDVRELGRIQPEYYPEKRLTRVLVGNYFTVQDAQKIVEKVKVIKYFKDAFVVEYLDGARLGRVK